MRRRNDDRGQQIMRHTPLPPSVAVDPGPQTPSAEPRYLRAASDEDGRLEVQQSDDMMGDMTASLVDRLAHRIDQAVILNPSQKARVLDILRDELGDDDEVEPTMPPPKIVGRYRLVPVD